MPNSNRHAVWRAAAPISLAAFATAIFAPVDSDVRAVLLGGLLLGWTIAACYWVVGRFGTVAALLLATISLALAGTGGYFYWSDQPNRHAVAEVKKLRATRVYISGKYFGHIESVTFDQYATDDNIQGFVELDGLDGLKILVLDNTPIRDETAKKLARFTSLEQLKFEGITLANSTIAHLSDRLPECVVDVR